jgi:hypothetical protein
MSGVKRRSGYRKNVTNDVLYSFPEPEPGQRIVQVVRSHGSNIFEVSHGRACLSAGLLPLRGMQHRRSPRACHASLAPPRSFR